MNGKAGHYVLWTLIEMWLRLVELGSRLGGVEKDAKGKSCPEVGMNLNSDQTTSLLYLSGSKSNKPLMNLSHYVLYKI